MRKFREILEQDVSILEDNNQKWGKDIEKIIRFSEKEFGQNVCSDPIGVFLSFLQ